MKPVIAVPYFPGSNGDFDVISRINENGMKASPLYFHIGNERRLEENARILEQEVDGAVLCGGFPYQDRLGFGIVPARIKPFAESMRALIDSGKPVIAFCSGNQIAHAMDLAFPKGSSYKIRMFPNICDRDGELVYYDFFDYEPYTHLECSPERTAFTRYFSEGEIIQDIIDHGGGRLWADEGTLNYLLENGMVVTRYCNKDGEVIDNFPVNPNGSMLNIESITNTRGNLKIGMTHHERKLNALKEGRANLVFASMRDYIESGCPDLSGHAEPQSIPLKLKDYSYLSQQLDPGRTIDIHIKMLTDDNERTTAQLFLGEGVNLDRRRLIRLELAEEYMSVGDMQQVLVEIAKMDFLDGIMLKKDLPSVTAQELPVYTYEVTRTEEGGRLVREFTSHEEIVEGFPVAYEEVSLPNPDGHKVREKLWENTFLKSAVTNVRTGKTWFFPDEKSKKIALENLLD